MPEIPVGYYKVDASVLPRGMTSYINSMMKQSMDLQKIGAYVNGQSLTCIFENGELICVSENKCFMKKVIGPAKEMTIDIQGEIDALKIGFDDDLLVNVFTDPGEEQEGVEPDIPHVIARSDDHGTWTAEDPELSIDEVKISFIGSFGQMDSTRPTVLRGIDEEIMDKSPDIQTTHFWEEIVPKTDRENLYKFLRSFSHETEFHLLARNKPLLTIRSRHEETWSNFGDPGSRLEILIMPPVYEGKFPPDNIVPKDGPVRWLLVSVYYLLYWVFKMIENNLGREFDGELKDYEGKSTFLRTHRWQ